jgi:hypothetical protein
VSESKACQCDNCGKVETLHPRDFVHPRGWVFVSGLPEGRRDFCTPGCLRVWAAQSPGALTQ